MTHIQGPWGIVSEIEVKALEWAKHPAAEAWRADTMLGTYQVWVGSLATGWQFDGFLGERINEKSTDDVSAKAAAQADHDARIRAALVERKAEPVAYASSKEWRKNHLMSAAQYKSALSKNIVDFDIPLYAHPPTAQGTVTEEMRVAACRSLNERGKGNNVTICDVVAMLEGALSASPSPVDSRELIERLVKATEHLNPEVEIVALHDPEYGDVTDCSLTVADFRAALAAKEQQP